MVQVCADSLGTRAIPLHPLLGRVDARRICPNQGLAAAFSLVTDVHHLNGGRQVTLRSVFRLQVYIQSTYIHVFSSSFVAKKMRPPRDLSVFTSRPIRVRNQTRPPPLRHSCSGGDYPCSFAQLHMAVVAVVTVVAVVADPVVTVHAFPLPAAASLIDCFRRKSFRCDKVVLRQLKNGLCKIILHTNLRGVERGSVVRCLQSQRRWGDMVPYMTIAGCAETPRVSKLCVCIRNSRGPGRRVSTSLYVLSHPTVPNVRPSPSNMTRTARTTP